MLATRMFFWWVPVTEPAPPDPPPTEPPPSNAVAVAEDPCTIFTETTDLLELSNSENLELSNGELLELVLAVEWRSSCDDAIGEQVMANVPIGGRRAEALIGPDHWVFINGVRSLGLKLASLSASRDLGQRGTMRFTMLKTPDRTFSTPPVGSMVQLSWHDHLQWAGVVENSRSVNREGTHDRVMEIQVDCASWERIAERRLTTTTYASKTTREIYLAVLAQLANEGIEEGVIDAGVTLTLAGPRQAGDYIRISELLRDVAEASGGVYDIDPFRRLNFRKETLGVGSLVMGNLVALHEVESNIERQDYRNVQVVRAKGTGTSELTYTRDSADEIAARQAVEGGSGRYENFEEVSHPFSDDPGDVGRLAVSVAVIKLITFGRHARTVSAMLDFPRYRLGDVVTANFPEHQAAGEWRLAGVRYRSIHDQLFATYELVQTSVLQRNFQSWLKITQTARALVQIPGTPVFSSTLVLTTSQTWIVPDANGDGTDVEVSFDLFGAGGGGTAAYPSANNNGQTPQFYLECGATLNFFGYPANGLGGSPGGRATSLRTLPVGTAITITIGAGGAGSAFSCASFFDNPTPGSQGALSSVKQGSTVIAQATGGGGGVSGVGPGGAVGDFTITGGGALGGAGGAIRLGSGGNGAAAYVEIRF